MFCTHYSLVERKVCTGTLKNVYGVKSIIRCNAINARQATNEDGSLLCHLCNTIPQRINFNYYCQLEMHDMKFLRLIALTS